MMPRDLIHRMRGSRLLIPGLLVLAFLIGFALRGGGGSPPAASREQGSEEAGGGEPTIWTCSMHPQIQLPEPGKCPICFMDLIPLETGGGGDDDLGPRALSMSESAARLAEIQTAPVERRFVDAQVRMVGKIEPDETRVKVITAWVPGRLDRLFVDYTGVAVRKGDHLIEIYSPELISAQEELLQSLRAARELERSNVSSVRTATIETVDAAREKLLLLGLTKGQIEAVEKRGAPTNQITIYAPIGGVVIHKQATEGMYVQTGTPIYTIADLSHLWVKLDAYESDLVWLRYGQEVEFTTEAYPGESFRGRIAFIDPVLNPQTRTVKVRVNVANPDGKLKPEMFVRAVAHARVASGGRVMDAALAGKWVGPMHPEIIKDGPGKCDICGMPLVRADELGYVASAADAASAPLVIPATAPLLTGKRAVVYVALRDRERPAFEGREVVLGPRAGDYYIVQEGLAEGEQVVTHGSFKIDSALQIQARPSMMNPEGGGPAGGGGHHHGGEGAAAPAAAARAPLASLMHAYLDVQEALVADDLERASAAFAAVAAATIAVPHQALGEAHGAWIEIAPAITAATEAGTAAPDLDGARAAFRDLTGASLELLGAFGNAAGDTVYTAFCPMAFANQGATWLQDSRQIQNPYLGQAMPRCGEIRSTFEPATAADGKSRP